MNNKNIGPHSKLLSSYLQEVPIIQIGNKPAFDRNKPAKNLKQYRKMIIEQLKIYEQRCQNL